VVARGAGFAAAKGAALIGLAVIIGIVLLNVVDDGSDGPVADDDTAATTTTGAPADTTTPPETPTTVDEVPAKTPAELAVLVLNGGAPQGSAKSMADDLKVKGYTNSLPPSDWSGKNQTGNVVLCKPGLDQEAAALATAVAEGTPVEPFPDPAPPGSETADCVVVVGTTG
jgi:LytR cell envelope-related transcriptional attenuator